MRSLHALADPTRRRIVEMLARGERSAGAIAAEFEVSAPAVSQHLKVLREARLVRVRVAAQQRFYALDDQGFSELDHWLAGLRRFWSSRLEALEAQLRGPAAKQQRKPATGKPRSRKSPQHRSRR